MEATWSLHIMIYTVEATLFKATVSKTLRIQELCNVVSLISWRLRRLQRHHLDPPHSI